MHIVAQLARQFSLSRSLTEVSEVCLLLLLGLQMGVLN